MSTTERPEPDLLALAYPYALDAITDNERQRIEHQREMADRVTATEFDLTVAGVHETLAALTVVDSVRPPAALEDRLMRALAGTVTAIDGHRSPPAHVLRRQSISRLHWLAAAVAVVIAIAVGTVAITSRHIDSPGGESITAHMIEQQPDMRTRTTRMATGGLLEVSSSASLSAAAVTFREVPDPVIGRSYQIWLVPIGGTPHSAAVLDAPPGQPLVTRFEAVETLAVTIEPAGGSPQPTSTPIASINLG
ncbi:anti-sigma factor domain-containing protein [Nocardia sp. KC 131]|uniref:anti-sigma factor n=1 Tax=Nocardia arseniciresistens TaxID=3392119 RepID=UPI00398EE739